MSTNTFSPVFGENVTLDKHSKQAKWEPKRSGGWIFSSTPLEAGREITITLNGSGHCDVGVIKTDPSKSDVMTDPAHFKKLNGIQIHKMKCCIPICLNREANEVKSKYQGDEFKKFVNKKTHVWIAVYVKFGEVTAELVEETTGKFHTFSETHGTNIRLESDKRKTETINSNPAALCFVGQVLGIGQTVNVVCEPIKVGSKKPSRFHIKLLVCRKNPESFLEDFRSAFDTSVPAISDPLVTILEVLEKDECDGTVSITLDQSLHMKYVSAKNKQNNQNLNFDPSNGVWIGFELYRVSVSLKSNKRPHVNSLGFDVPDSRIREPQNENAENSIEPFNSFVNQLRNKHIEVNYVSEESANLMTRNNNAKVNENLTCPLVKRKYNLGQKMSLQPDIQTSAHHIYANTNQEKTKPKEINGYVQRQPDKKEVQCIDYVQEIDPKITTSPKASPIPRPLEIPAPKLCSQIAFETTKSPSKTTSTVKHVHNKMQKTNIVQEMASQPLRGYTTHSPPTSFKSLTDESLIVSHLSRIERTLSDLAEKVNVGPSNDTSNHKSVHTSNHTLERQRSGTDNNLSDFDEATENFIKKNWVKLVENVCADKICDFLYQEDCIRDDQRQFITDLYKTDSQAANRKLLQLIKKRRISTSSLVKIFKDAEQGHLVADLD